MLPTCLLEVLIVPRHMMVLLLLFEIFLVILFTWTSFPFLMVLIMPLTMKMELLAHSADSWLKSLQERCAAFQGLDSQVFGLKKQVTDLNDMLSSSDAAFVKAKAKGKDQKKKIKSLSKNLDQLTTEVVCLFAALNQATVLEAKSDEFSRVQGEHLPLAANATFERGLSMHQTQEEFAAILNKIFHFVPDAQGRLAEASLLVAQTDYPLLKKIFNHATDPLSAILQLEPEKLARLGGVPASKDTHVSPLIVMESIVTSDSASLELVSTNAPFSYAAVFGGIRSRYMLVMMLGCPWIDRSIFPSVLMMLWLLSPLERKIMIPLILKVLLLVKRSGVMPPALSRIASPRTVVMADQASVEAGVDCHLFNINDLEMRKPIEIC
nr:hypothetical protein [Tanacetum cinerariifolium]